MALIRITRFTLAPERVEEMLTTRATLIAAIRARQSGLTETRLARADETSWLDSWRWDSPESLQAAQQAAASMPEAAAAFAIATDATAEQAEIVDER